MTQYLSEWVQKKRRFSEIMFDLSVGIILKKPKILTFCIFFLNFQFTFLLFIVFLSIIRYCGTGLIANLDVVGRVTGEDASTTILRDTLNISYYLVLAFRGKIVMQFINLQIAMLLYLAANAKIKENIDLFG